MERAIQLHDMAQFNGLAEALRQAQELWLQTAQGMSPEKAHAYMVGFALSDVTTWMVQRKPGPPPTVLSHFR